MSGTTASLGPAYGIRTSAPSIKRPLMHVARMPCTSRGMELSDQGKYCSQLSSIRCGRAVSS
jgi:hypothetical protein